MALPIILPLAIGALVLVGCAKVASDVRKSRPLPTLEGSEWAPIEAAASEQFVAFKSAGDINGHGGCNQFFGQYTQTGQTLTIGALASTKKYCADIMQAETDFIQTLQDARRFEATQLKLTLYGANGTAIMSLQRRDWD